MKKVTIYGILAILFIMGFYIYNTEKSYSPIPYNSITTSTTTESSDNQIITEKIFTKEELAKHADVSSCYSSINGFVYDLTAWISKHPGGKTAILSICGKDGSSAFNGQHGGKEKQEVKLETFKIGTLSDESTQIACTMDAKMCPDGTYVGRSGPTCEFVCP